MMDGVITPERNLLLKIHHNIPSFIIVKGTKLRVYYPGQPKTCGRCHRYWNTCPGGGKVDKCKKAKGEEKPLKTAFKQLVARIKKKEINPQESSSPLVPMNIPDPDEIVFSGFKEDMGMPVFTAWLKSNEINFKEVMVFKAPSETWRRRRECSTNSRVCHGRTEDKRGHDLSDNPQQYQEEGGH